METRRFWKNSFDKKVLAPSRVEFVFLGGGASRNWFILQNCDGNTCCVTQSAAKCRYWHKPRNRKQGISWRTIFFNYLPRGQTYLCVWQTWNLTHSHHWAKSQSEGRLKQHCCGSVGTPTDFHYQPFAGKPVAAISSSSLCLCLSAIACSTRSSPN